MVEIISEDTFWSSHAPIVLTDRILVENGATLTIGSGAVVDGNGYRIDVVDGSFVAEGGGGLRVTLQDLFLDASGTGVVLNQVDMYRGALSVNAINTSIVDSTFRNTVTGAASVQLYDGAEVIRSVFIHSTPLSILGDNVTVTDNAFLFQEGIHFFTGQAGLEISNNVFATGPRAYAYRDLLAVPYQGEIEVTGSQFYGVAEGDYNDRIFDHSQYSALGREIIDPDPASTSSLPDITIHDSGSLVRVGPKDTSLIGPILSPDWDYALSNDGAIQVEEGEWAYVQLGLPQPPISYSDPTPSRPYNYDVTYSLNYDLSTVEADDFEQISGMTFLPAVDAKVEPTETVVFDIELSGEYFGNEIAKYQLAFEILDKPFGTEASDELVGNALENLLEGLGGDDTILGGMSDDTIDGGAGVDTARYSGSQTGYTLTLSPTGTTISDRRFKGDGTDELKEIELLDFETNILGEPFDLRMLGGPTSLDPAQLDSFIELYIAYFNRAPDAIGLNFWGTAFANGVTLEESARFFIDQDETRATYPEALTNAEFATAVYANVLGREGDEDGFNFWVGVLDGGAVGRDQFILAVLGGAKADPPADASPEFIAQQLADRAYLETKTDIGAYYAVHRGMSDVSNASAAMAVFDGTTSSVTQAINAIDGYYQSALDPDTGEFLMQIVGVLDNPFAA